MKLDQVRILGVTAYPLDEKMRNDGKNYSLSYKMGILLPVMDNEVLFDVISAVAKGILAASHLSYIYTKGDTTCFIVEYKTKVRGSRKKFTFVSNGIKIDSKEVVIFA